MNTHLNQPAHESHGSETLEQDPRWQLVLRIAESPALARARQLRQFLLYSSRWVIENPGKPINEYDIALNVMGRRADFDAAHDNIVRVQATHLRRRLESYFASDGAGEELLVVLPKGSYAPQFLVAEHKPVAAGVDSELHPGEGVAREAGPAQVGKVQPWFARPWIWVALLAVVVVVLAVLLVFALQGRKASPLPKNQAILAPMLRNGKQVTIVLPDLGLSVVQNLMGKEVDLQQYAAGAFPETLLQSVANPNQREALTYIGSRRAISYSEVNVLLELVRGFQSQGVTPVIRFARDIHVRDLGAGNVVLIGSRRSNLWASLFADRTNFRFVEDPKSHEYYFENQAPQGTEQKRYLPTYTPHGGDGYIDVALLPNTTNSGYLLLVDGSDAEVNESAIRYLLEGSLPAPLLQILNRPHLSSFEIFLCGRHLMNEADDNLQVIGTRQRFD